MNNSLLSPVLGSLAFAILLLSPAMAQSTDRVSVDSAGVEGDRESQHPSTSADGRYVAFWSRARNLVPGDTNGQPDVFVHDRQNGQTTLVSVSSTGVQGDGDSINPHISGDGRYVAFESYATNLVANDTNGDRDIFVHDRLTSRTLRVSVHSAGIQADRSSYASRISRDGRFVAFISSATNLVPADTNGVNDVFVHDLLTGKTTRANVDSSGVQANGSLLAAPGLSADGRYVVFDSHATNLVPGDTNAALDVFVHDRLTGQTTRVSVDSNGAQTGGASTASITADGRLVGFQSAATDLVPGDTNNNTDVFVHDQLTGQTILISVSTAGQQGDGFSGTATISAQGRRICFQSSAANLTPGDVNGVADVFVHDILTGQTSLISVDSPGAQGNGASGVHSSLTADGRTVFFASSASNLVPGDTNGASDVFVHESGPLELTLQGVGACPGTIELSVFDATPLGSVALLFGPAGSFVQSGGPCSGLTLALSAPQLAAVVSASSAGIAHHSLSAPVNVCSMSMQAVDLTSCVASNALALDTRTVSISMTGTCDGVLSVTVIEATPGQPVALLYGPAGSFVKAGGACAGLTLGISAPALAGVRVADASGEVQFGRYAPPSLCGASVQAVDLTTCTASEAHTIEQRVISLRRSGSCSLRTGVTLTLSNLKPGKLVALLTGTAGSHVQLSGACAGVTLSLSSPALLTILTADAVGGALYGFTPPPALCGMTVQAVEHGSCALSNTVTLP